MTLIADNLNETADLSNRPETLPDELRQLTLSRGILQRSTSSVKQLLLRRNDLESLQEYAKMIYLLRQSLRELSLRDNRLARVPVELFPLTQLTSLSLASNRLESICEGIFPRFSCLQWLTLSGNQLSALPNDLMKCIQLKGIDIHNNRFTALPRAVSYLSNLEILLVHHNQIDSIPDDFVLCSKLQTLNLSFNLFYEIPLPLIQCPPAALSHLYLSGNPLRRIAPAFLQSGYSELVSLDLHTCQIATLEPDFFLRLSACKLRRLNLAINMLVEIPAEVGLLTTLEWLNLNDNRLLHLPSSMSNLSRLVKFGLVQNQLESLPIHLFSRMHKLRKLDIRRNRLRYFPSSLLAMVPLSDAASNIDVAAPLAVSHMSACPPSCPIQIHDSFLGGGSLRTLLCAENPNMMPLDGVVFKGIPSETADLHRLSGDHVIAGTQQPNDPKSSDNLFNSIVETCYQAQDQQRHQSTRMESRLVYDVHGMSQFSNAKKVLPFELTKVPTLREIAIRVILNKGYGKHLRVPSTTQPTQAPMCLEHMPVHHPHLGIYPEYRHQYLEASLPRCIPDTLRQMILRSAKQCDNCRQWFSESRLQVAYTSRICVQRHLVPIRFEVCSVECALKSTLNLQIFRDRWVGTTQNTLGNENGGSNDGFATAGLQTPSPTPVSVDRWNLVGATCRCLGRVALSIATSLISGRQDGTSDTPPEDDGPPALMPVLNRFPSDATQPRATRISAAAPTTVAFNHLPRDAIRLEKF